MIPRPSFRFASASPVLCALLLAGPALAAEKNLPIPQLITQLANGDVPARREASYQLANLGPKAKEAVPALIKALDDQDKQVWVNAIAAIAAIGPDAKEAIPALVEDLDSKKGKGQRSYYKDQILIRSSYALTRIGPAAVPALIEGLRGKDVMLQTGSARALGGMGPAAQEAIPALIENLAHWDAGMQRDVVDALSAIGPAAKPKLIEALAWNDPKQRSNAALALAGMGTSAKDAGAPLLARLKGETDLTVRASLLAALPRVGADPAQVVLALIAGLQDSNEAIRRASTNSLLTMRAAQGDTVKALIAMVRDPKTETSDLAAYVLGRLGESAGPAVPALLEVVAKRAAQPAFDALVQIGEPAAGPILDSVVKADPATITRDHWAVKCLQQMGGVATGPAAHHLTHPNATVRLLAARTLIELGSDAEPATAALTKALDDTDLRVRAAALVALVSAHTAVEHLGPHLEKAFQSESPIVRAAAVEGVVRLGAEGKDFRGKVVAALNDPDESVRRTVINQLGPDYADAVPQLIPLLADPKRRAPAMEALGRIGPGSKAAVPALVKLLPSGTSEERLKVLEALTQIAAGATEALPALEAARKDTDPAIRVAAYKAGAAIDAKKSSRVATLITGLDDSDRNVRKGVAQIIGSVGDSAQDAQTKLIALTGDDGDREFALAALNEIRVKDIAKLAELVQHPNREVQLFAIHRLDNLGRRAKDASPALEAMVKSPDQELSRAARRALASINLK